MRLNLNSPGFKISPLQVILVLAILQISISLLTNGFALSFDESIWHYIGRNWFRNGLVPYRGGVDNKSPLIFAIYGLSDKLFGVNYWFPRVLGTACQSIGIYYVYRIAKHAKDQQTGLIALSLYGLSLMWRSTDGKWVSLTETYEVTLIILSFYRYFAAKQRIDFFLSGLFAGFGFGFRLSAFFGILALFISLSRKKNMGFALLFCAGLLTSLLCLVALAFFAGIHLQDYLTYGFRDNFGPGSPTDFSLLWKLENFVNHFFYSELLLFYPAVVGYLLLYKKLDTLLLWVICEFTGIAFIGIFDRSHIKELLPGMSLISAFAIGYWIQRYQLPARQVMLILWIVFFPKLLEPLVNLKKLWSRGSAITAQDCHEPYSKPDETMMKKLGIWIKSVTADDERVLVAGFGAQVQVYTERLSPSIYFNATQTPLAKERFYSDIRLKPPGMVLVPLFPEYLQNVDPDIRHYIDSLVNIDYSLTRCSVGYAIYQKNAVHH